jgi:hypothetical protein
MNAESDPNVISLAFEEWGEAGRREGGGCECLNDDQFKFKSV